VSSDWDRFFQHPDFVETPKVVDITFKKREVVRDTEHVTEKEEGEVLQEKRGDERSRF
jgi:hypothetical protein